MRTRLINGGKRYRSLALTAPGDRSPGHSEDVSRSGSFRIAASPIVGVNVCKGCEVGIPGIGQPKVERVLNISHNVHKGVPMVNPRVGLEAGEE